MAAEKWDDASLVINDIISIDPTNAVAFFLRCQCNLGRWDEPEANADLATFRRYGKDSPEAIEAAMRIEEQLLELRESLRNYGSKAALDLRNKAVEAFNGERIDDAILLMRDAIQLANGATQVRTEFSQVLTASAYKIMEKVQHDPSTLRTNARLINACLEEALSLDPKNEDPLQLLRVLKVLTGQEPSRHEKQADHAEPKPWWRFWRT